MPETFMDTDRRLVMRYDNAATFSLSKVRTLAANEAVFSLAEAISTVQHLRPNRVTSVVTQQLIR